MLPTISVCFLMRLCQYTRFHICNVVFRVLHWLVDIKRESVGSHSSFRAHIQSNFRHRDSLSYLKIVQIGNHLLNFYKYYFSFLHFGTVFCNLEMFCALGGVVQRIEPWLVNWKVSGSIPSQGTCLCCGPGLQLGAC